MSGNIWHYYAEIYYNGIKSDGIYKYGSGVVRTSLIPENPEWYDELRDAILKDLGAATKSLKNLKVVSLTKL